MFSWFRKNKKGAEQKAPDIEAFLVGTGCDNYGRYYNQIISYDDKELEKDHTFIQWVFPTENPSMFHPEVPVVSKEQAAKLTNITVVKENLHRMFVRMLLFYGIRLISNVELEETKDDNVVMITQGRRTSWVFEKERIEQWVQEGNHNLLRISRILESLRLFERKPEHTLMCDVIKAIAAYKPEVKDWSCWAYWMEYAKYEK